MKNQAHSRRRVPLGRRAGIRGVLAAAIVAAASMAAAAPASATVTSTQITSPATNTVFSNPNLLGPAETLAFSGTSDGSAGDVVDVFCVYTVPRQAANHSTTPLATVTVQDGGGFSGSVTQQSFDWDRCTLIAVPQGGGPAAAPSANYTGPEISNGGFKVFRISDGPNAGEIRDVYQTSAAREGLWATDSAGNCQPERSIPINATPGQNNDYNHAVWGCSVIPQDNGGPPELRIDGATAALPDSLDPNTPGFTGVENFESSIEQGTGNMRMTASERAVNCLAPGFNPCATTAPSGVRLDESVIGGTNGHTLLVDHRWVNTAATTKQLDVTYSISLFFGDDYGWRFPGESSYESRDEGDMIVPPPSGPWSFFGSRSASTTCATVVDPCGSVTVSQRPDAIVFGYAPFGNALEVLLTFHAAIPPGCAAHYERIYSHGYSQASVDAYAAAGEAAQAGQPLIFCPSPPEGDPPPLEGDPPPPAPAEGTPKQAALVTGKVKTNGKRIALRLSCAPAGGNCDDNTIALRAKRTRLGRAAFSIPAGETQKVVVRLRKKGRKLFRIHRTVKATATITDGGQSSVTVLKIKTRNKKRHESR